MESRSEYLESTIGSRLSRLLVLVVLCLVGVGVYWNWKDVSANAQEVIQAYIKPKLQHDRFRLLWLQSFRLRPLKWLCKQKRKSLGNLPGS